MDIEAIRRLFNETVSGRVPPELVVIPEAVLRRHFGDEAVDAAFADGTASYLTEDDEA